MKNTSRKIVFIQIGLILCLTAAGAGLLAAARIVPGFAAWYSDAVYPVLVNVFGRFWGLFPFSVVEWMLYGLILMLIFLLFRYWKRPLRLLRYIGLILSSLLFSYAACCGVNYYRVPFSTYYLADMEELLEEEGRSGAEADLEDLCLWLTEEVNEARAQLDPGMEYERNLQEKGVDAMNRISEQYPVLGGYYPQPKPVAVSLILSVQQCSGVYSPFTIEANYNRDMVSYNIPHTICHELSHLRGFMREDEANFIGYLACLESEDAFYRYSGCLLGWIYAGNALAKTDRETYTQIHGMLSDEVRADLAANTDFWNRYEGEAAEIQERVNDAYLKANGQAEGVKTYGRVVDLMLLDFAVRRQG